MLVSRYSVLWEKIGPILQSLVGLMVGKQAGRQDSRRSTGDLENLELLYRLNYSDFYNITTILLQY